MIFESTHGWCVPLQYRVAKPDLKPARVGDPFHLPHSRLVLQAVKDLALGKDADTLEAQWISITVKNVADTEKTRWFRQLCRKGFYAEENN